MHQIYERLLTRGSQHLLAGEHCVRTSHETHGLFGFWKHISSSSEPDDCLGKHYASSGNGANQGVVLHGLNLCVVSAR